MARAIKPGLLTPADTARELLAQSEKRVVAPDEGAGVLELLGWMDELADLWPELEASGADLRGERTRWESLQSQVQARAARLLRAWQGPQTLAQARQAANPARDHWWWWLDRWLADARRRRMRRVAIGAAAAVVAGLALVFVLSRVFRVDPQVQAVYRLQLAAEEALQAGDPAAARPLLEQAAAIDPGRTDVQVLLGAVADRLGDTAQAEQAWQAARVAIGDEARFLAQRGRAYLQVGLADQALQDEQAAIQLQPDLAAAHFFLGMALETAGRSTEAIQAYSRASELAVESDPQLVVMARSRLAALLQQPVSPAPTGGAP